MELIKKAFIGCLLATMPYVLIAFAAQWEPEPVLRAGAVLLAVWFSYCFAGHWFITHMHINGEGNRQLFAHEGERAGVRGAEWSAPQLPPGETIDGSYYAQPAGVATAPVTKHEIVLVQTNMPEPDFVLPSGIKIPRQDVAAFVELLDKKGNTRAPYIGIKMPSGRVIDTIYYQTLIEAVAVSGEYPKRGQGIRKERKLTTAQIKAKLNL